VGDGRWEAFVLWIGAVQAPAMGAYGGYGEFSKKPSAQALAFTDPSWMELWGACKGRGVEI